MRMQKDYVQDREMRRTGGTPERAGFHSKGYHRYFEGYSECRELDKSGRVRIRRVYTGVYHAAELEDGQRKRIKALYCVLWLASLLLYLFVVTRPVGSNTCYYVTASEALSLAGLAWLAWSLFNYVTAGKRMTLGEYCYAEAVKRSSRFTAVVQAATAAATLVYSVLSGGDGFLQGLLCFTGALLCAGLCFSIFYIERKIVYRSFLSEKEGGEEAQQITY